jgi:putative restriction endonuclease
MPRQTRTEQHWGDGLPIMRTSQYCVTHINFGKVSLEPQARALCEVRTVEITNQYQQDTIDVPARFAQVQSIWAARKMFDEPLAGLIAQHENMVRSGSALGSEAHKLVDRLQEAASVHATDYGTPGNAPTADVLPALLRISQKSMILPPSAPIDQIPVEEIQIRRREVKQWRLWAASRGASSARFRREVREAYRSTCLVCGLCLPTLGSDSNPGVDAAHILPWAQFDLDHVKNGFCLCKLHHWAFDEGLIDIYFNGTDYAVRLPHEAEDDMLDKPEFNIDFLRSAVGVIPESRLPYDPNAWPSPDLLEKLRVIMS